RSYINWGYFKRYVLVLVPLMLYISAYCLLEIQNKIKTSKTVVLTTLLLIGSYFLTGFVGRSNTITNIAKSHNFDVKPYEMLTSKMTENDLIMYLDLRRFDEWRIPLWISQELYYPKEKYTQFLDFKHYNGSPYRMSSINFTSL